MSNLPKKGCVSRFITPPIYGDVLANSWGVNDLPIPADACVEWADSKVPKSQTSLHLDARTAYSIRKVYGYIGHIRRLKSSGNTDSPFFFTVVSKLALDDDKDFTNLTNLAVCFVRIGASASNWAPAKRNSASSNFTLGDFVGYVLGVSFLFRLN